MADYLDFHANLQMFLRSLDENKNEREIEERKLNDQKRPQRVRRRRYIDRHVYQVRSCICVTGFNRSAIQRVKSLVASLTDEPLPLESFQVIRKTDIKDGALLVPKVILVAVHCPGKKLIDEEGDEGQLDYIYDEVVQLGADILVIYLDLPGLVYPPAKNYIYHPRMADLLFPTQPLLQSLAMDQALVTVTHKSDFNTLQRNVIREWATRHIPNNHRIFRSAASLLSENSLSEADWWSEGEALSSCVVEGSEATNRGFVSATEEHPVAERKSKYLTRKRGNYGSVRTSDSSPRSPLLSLTDDGDAVEMDLYNERYSYHSDSMRLSEQV